MFTREKSYRIHTKEHTTPQTILLTSCGVLAIVNDSTAAAKTKAHAQGVAPKGSCIPTPCDQVTPMHLCTLQHLRQFVDLTADQQTDLSPTH